MIKITRSAANTLLLALCLVAVNAAAQNNFNCSSGELFIKQMQDDPEFAKNQKRLEEETRQFNLGRGLNKVAQATRIIPVVFHVIHAGGIENISMAQIQDQMRILNEEFPRLQADTILTPIPFQSVAAGFNVEFRLATLDPNGNCTQGVTRTYSTLTTCSMDQDQVKSLVYWPSNQYLNIWLVSTMHYAGQTGCSGGGYATFPGGSVTLDGINIRADLISSIGTSATNSGWGNFKGRYLVHELGHWFNLRHIWGDMNCGDDFVGDTPPAETSNSGCPTFPYNAFNTCGSDANGEMFDNYMDYSQGACLNIFTQGQVARMDATLNSGVSGRSNLWSAANLIATGTTNPAGALPTCAPIPDILPATYKTICPGSTVTFIDVSYSGRATTRTWNCPGGTINGTSSDSVLSVTYANPGIYDVDLSVGNASGTNTSTFYSKVYVLDNVANINYTMPDTDSFENPAYVASDWSFINIDQDNGWELSTSTGYTGANSLTMQNYGSGAPLIDEAITPSYDISNLSGVSVKFRLSFAAISSASTDELRVYLSKDCGQTWQQRYYKTAAGGLSTTADNANYFIPSYASAEWREESFIVQSFNISSNFRLKFKFTSGGGNNIYIDDINIIGTPVTAVNSIIDHEEGLSVFPNPSSNFFHVKFNLLKTTPIKMDLTDIYGKLVANADKGMLNEGEHEVKLNTTGLAAGIYFLNVYSGNLNLARKKIIIE